MSPGDIMVLGVSPCPLAFCADFVGNFVENILDLIGRRSNHSRRIWVSSGVNERQVDEDTWGIRREDRQTVSAIARRTPESLQGWEG